MGNLISGILLLCAIIGMFFGYRPKRKDSLKICGIGIFMALLSIMMDDGIVSLQVVQHLMQFFVLSSCFLQLRQEKKQRKDSKGCPQGTCPSGTFAGREKNFQILRIIQKLDVSPEFKILFG